MYTVPFFHRGDTEAPQRPQRPQRRKRDAFFQRGHRGRIFFLLMCQKFGHHTNKCNNPPACRWCSSPHLTGAHSCPTSTCSANGRPCSHTLAKCANCSDPHESHFKDCPRRLPSSEGDDMEADV